MKLKSFIALFVTSFIVDHERPEIVLTFSALFLGLLYFNFHPHMVLSAIVPILFYRLNNLDRSSNHGVLIFFISLFITISYIKKYISKESDDQTLKRLTPLCLSYLAIVYFFAGFHKFNYEFFTQKQSCLFDFLERRTILRYDLPIDENLITYIFPFLAGSVVLVEMLSGITFFIKKIRWIGILSMTSLHCYLSFIGFHDFSFLGVSIMYLALKDQLPHKKFSPLGPFKLDIDKRVLTFILVNLPIIYISTLHITFDNIIKENYRLFLQINLLSGLIFTTSVCYFFFPFFKNPWHYNQGPSLKPRRWWHGAYLIPPILLGLTPYLGLSTQMNFSMFSNLRTEGNSSNHYLLASNPIKLFSFQDEIVEILDTGKIKWSPWTKHSSKRSPRWAKGHRKVKFGPGCFKEKGCPVPRKILLLNLRKSLYSLKKKGYIKKLPVKLRFKDKVVSYENILEEDFFTPSHMNILMKYIRLRKIKDPQHFRQYCMW